MDEDVIGSHVIGVARVPVALLRGDGLPEVETIALTKSLKNKENRGQIKNTVEAYLRRGGKESINERYWP